MVPKAKLEIVESWATFVFGDFQVATWIWKKMDEKEEGHPATVEPGSSQPACLTADVLLAASRAWTHSCSPGWVPEAAGKSRSRALAYLSPEPAVVLFFSSCRRRRASLLRHLAPPPPSALCQNWPRHKLRHSLVHLLEPAAVPRRTGVGRATSSSSRTVRARPELHRAVASPLRWASRSTVFSSELAMVPWCSPAWLLID
jgi:hypothetical protein